MIFPASHYVTPADKMATALDTISEELAQRLKEFRDENKLLEAQRLEQRTNFDMEMMQEMGYCQGIENYSRHLTGRKPGEAPVSYTHLDVYKRQVYAYQVGRHDECQRSSDDGEPAGTAGRPVLEVIKNQQLKNTAVVVTRYFGGILLGAGGLVRAYSKTAALALAAAQVVYRIPAQSYSPVSYTHLDVYKRQAYSGAVLEWEAESVFD